MRKSKLVSLEDAARRVENGMRIVIGGLAVNQHPMALVREIVRQSRRSLTVIGSLNGIETDLLIGAGCVDSLETSTLAWRSSVWLRTFGAKSSEAD